MITRTLNRVSRRVPTSHPVTRIVARSFLLAVALLASPSPALAQETAPQDRKPATASPSSGTRAQKAEDPGKPSAVALQTSEPSAAKAEGQVGKDESKRLDPERVKYAFYSLFFTVIPLSGLVLYLMLLLHFGRPESRANFEPFFGGGQITQLVVIIIVAGNICSLAIAGIIGASEVAAIYGGIVGYILGKDKK